MLCVAAYVSGDGAESSLRWPLATAKTTNLTTTDGLMADADSIALPQRAAGS